MVKAILSDFIRADGTARIYIYVYEGGRKSKVPTPFYCKPENWTGSEVSRKHPQAQYINPKLRQIITEIETKGTPSNISPSEYFKTYIELCKRGEIVKRASREPMTENYIKTLVSTLHHFDAYGKVSWDDFGESFFDRFVVFLRTRGLRQNTIIKYMKNLTLIVEHARRKGVHTNPDTRYSMQREKPQKIHLTPDEVKRMSEVNLKEWPDLQAEQDRFIIADNLLLRFGDSVSIKPENIVKRQGRHFLDMTTEKTRKRVLIPLRNKTLEILRRRDFKLPKANSRSNQKLKKIGMIARVNEPVLITEFKDGKRSQKVYKKYQLIETHTTRRSAARNLFESGLDPNIIMALGGWATLKMLMAYIDISAEHAAEKAAAHPFFN